MTWSGEGNGKPRFGRSLTLPGARIAAAFPRVLLSNRWHLLLFPFNIGVQSFERRDRKTFYGGDAHGYTDYPFYSEVAVKDHA